MKYTPEQIEHAKALTFYSNDLYQEITIGEWMKRMLLTLFHEEEGFSGKRPFGNSSWKHDAQIALVRIGLVDGDIDREEGWLNDINDEQCETLFNDIIRSFK